MKKPCEKCIVQPMCKKGCDELYNYLSKTLDYGLLTEMYCFRVANRLRKKEIVLYNGDKDWRYCKRNDKK